MQNDEVVLHIDGKRCTHWDNLSVDSDIGIPADAFRFEWFGDEEDILPEQIKEGKVCRVSINNTTVMVGILDSINQRASKSGVNTDLSGRDLVGQLVDCSAPIKSARNLSLKQLLQRYVSGGHLAELPFKIGHIQNNWLKAKTGVDLGASIWDVIVSAAEASGQYVWLSAEGELCIGNPFDVIQPKSKPILNFYKDDRRTKNNVLQADYQANMSDVYSKITVIGQNSKGRNFKASATDSKLPFKRTKIMSESRADSQKEAEQYAQKAMRDAGLNAYDLSVLVHGWTHDNEPWSTGWTLDFKSDIYPRAIGEWVVYGRTFELSRENGKTTELRLKRKADWMQPIKHKDLINK